MRAPALKTTLLTFFLALPSVIAAKTLPEGSNSVPPPALSGSGPLELVAHVAAAPVVVYPIIEIVNAQTYARGAKVFLLGEPQAQGLSLDGTGTDWEMDASTLRAFWTVPADQPLGQVNLVTRCTNGTTINMPLIIVEAQEQKN